MSRVIYLLGAGASAKSLPMVNEIPLFFELFHLWVKWHLAHMIPANGVNHAAYEHFFDFALKQIEESKQYPSPDTYARILQLTGDAVSYQRFNSFVALFFLWKESILGSYCSIMVMDDVLKFRQQICEDGSLPTEAKERMLKDFERLKRQIESEKIYDKLKYNIDPRYFGFFSTILDNVNNRKMSNDIGIISWNFDTQIERVLRRLDTKILDENYIKLNGDVRFFRVDNDTVLSNDAQFYNIHKPNDLMQLIENFSDLKSNIRYSWDHTAGEHDLKIQNLALGLEKVIVIGYSFPVYNRITDTYVFRKLREEIERVGAVNVRFEIVGRSEDTFKKQKSSFFSILKNAGWNISDNTDYIKFQNSPDQFPIPNEISILGK